MSSSVHPALSAGAGELAKLLKGRLVGPADLTITGINSLDDAGPGEITFLTSDSYAARWSSSRAAAALVSEDLDVPGHDPAARALIYVPNAELAMIAVLERFEQARAAPEVGVHPTAFVDPDAQVAGSARIGPHVSVGAGSCIGANAVLHAGVRVYEQVVIGEDSEIHANCVIRERCELGRRVVLHPNVTIGADGFGYRPAPDGSGLHKVPQIGNVRIGDDVEIGANSCIDRGKFGATRIGAGTKIDNLVQIAHNCRIGECCVIAGSVGIAGSVTLGDGVQVGGRAGVSDHLTIGAGAAVGGGAIVFADIPAGETWVGYPADQMGRALRQWAAIRRLAKKSKSAASDRDE